MAVKSSGVHGVRVVDNSSGVYGVQVAEESSGVCGVLVAGEIGRASCRGRG